MPDILKRLRFGSYRHRMAFLRNIRFHNRGFCWQSNYFAGSSQWRVRRFHAVVVTFEHPVFGRCQIDTGYGRRVLMATRGLPERVLRWTTPLPKQQWPFRQPSPAGAKSSEFDAPERDSKEEIAVDHLFLSHFHVDHIGGLDEIQAKSVVYRRSALTQLTALGRWQRLHHGFLSALVTESTLAKGQSLDEDRWSLASELDSELRTLDYWGDGSLRLIDLPGHSLGHYGFLLRGESQTLLYAVDAFWDYEVYHSAKNLPWVGRKVQHDYPQYCETQKQLRQIEETQGVTVLACHCERTQRYVNQAAD